MSELLTGIQQVGIGVRDVDASFYWAHRMFDFDIPVFDDEAEAKLMTRYTGGEVHSRRALLALNLAGGGGFEIWSFKSRDSQPPSFTPELGDIGINEVRLKVKDIEAAHRRMLKDQPEAVSMVAQDPSDNSTFTVTDPFGNTFRLVESKEWFCEPKHGVGGVCGATIGVHSIDNSLPFYRDVLGLDDVVYDEEGTFHDLDNKRRFRRVLLHKPQADEGAFARLFGSTSIELVQSLDKEGRAVFENRFWGDLGYIHLCFDVNDMDALKSRCESIGAKFTVDSAESFDMGEAEGRFAYVEDPDGTWIEFVQAHKVPILKKLGWFIDLRKRRSNTPLPDWMLKSMGLNRVSPKKAREKYAPSV